MVDAKICFDGGFRSGIFFFAFWVVVVSCWWIAVVRVKGLLLWAGWTLSW